MAETMQEVIIKFEGDVGEFNTGANKLLSILESLQKGLNEATSDMATFGEATKNATSNIKSSQSSTSKTSTGLARLAAVVGVAGAGIAKMASKAWEWTQASADAISTQIRFNSVFGDTEKELQEVTAWVEEYTNALLLNEDTVYSAVSEFKILASTLGITGSESTKMAENLTALAYDLSAVYGENVTSVINSLNSALAGQGKALTKYGVSITQANLQNQLYALGYDKTVSSLNSAEKATLIYYYTMNELAGMQGYYASTMLTPATAIKTVKNQFSNLTKEIGNLFIPILMALYPYLVALTQLLREAAEALAAFFGFDINFDDAGTSLNIDSSAFDSVAESASSAADEVERLSRDFDELHIVNFDTGSSSGSDSGTSTGNSLASLLDGVDYSYWNDAADQLAEKLEKVRGIVELIGTALAALTIATLLAKFLEFIGVLDKACQLSFVLGAALIGISVKYYIEDIQEMLENGFSWETFKKTIIEGIGAGLGTTLVASALGLSATGSIGLGLTVAASFIGFSLGIGAGDKLAGWMEETLGYEGIYKSLQQAFGKENVTMEDLDNITVWQTIKFVIDLAVDSITASFDLKTIGIALGVALIAGIVLAFVGAPVIIVAAIVIVIAALIAAFCDKLGINSPSTVFYDFGVYILEGLINGIIALKDKVVEKITELVEKIVDKATEMKDKFVQKVTDLKDKVVDKITTLKTNVTDKIESMKTAVVDKVTSLKTKFVDKFTEIKTKISDIIENIKTTVKNGVQKLKDFFDFDWKLPDIKLPHFTVTWNTDGAVAAAFQAIGMQGTPKIGVDWYANGGFPDTGDLFVANEAGAEWVGAIGNKTAVANNDQITAGVQQGAYQGMKEALAESNLGGTTKVYVGSRQVAAEVTREQNNNIKRFGR